MITTMKIATILLVSAAALMTTVASCSSKKGLPAPVDDNDATETTSPQEEPIVGVSLDGDKPIIMRRGLNGLNPDEDATEQSGAIIRVEHPIIGSAPMALPKAILYKMSGDYADRVPVQMAADGQLISFPAPTDIPSNPEPIKLVGGWLISPVGVSSSSVFTRWTYTQYRALSQTPTPEEIRAAVIPGAKVTMTMAVPFTVSEALADTAAVNEFIMANEVRVLPTR